MRSKKKISKLRRIIREIIKVLREPEFWALWIFVMVMQFGCAILTVSVSLLIMEKSKLPC